MKLANVLLIIISLISVIIFLKIGIKNTGNWRFYSSLFGMIGGCITGAKIGATGGTVALPGIGTITGGVCAFGFYGCYAEEAGVIGFYTLVGAGIGGIIGGFPGAGIGALAGVVVGVVAAVLK